MSQRLNPARSGRGIPLVGRRRLHPISETSDSRRIETYRTGFADGFLAAEDGATNSSIIKEAITMKRRTKMVKRLERCVSDDDDTMANRMARTREWVQHQSASLALDREALAPCKDTFDTCDDTSSSLVTPSSISTSEDGSDFSLRNESKSMAELEEAELDAIKFLEALENYKKRSAQRWEAECPVKTVKEPENQDSTSERLFTLAHDSRQNFSNEPLGKGAMVASEGTEEQNARIQSDTMEVNHTHQKSLVPTAEKVDKGESSHEMGRLQPTPGDDNQMQSPSTNDRSSKAMKLSQVGKKGVKRGGRVVGKIFPCKICLRPFTNRNSAYLHAHTHLSRDELEQASIFHGKCPHCQRMFFTRQHFTYHMNVHGGRRNHDCPVCKKKFATKAHLTSHHFVHFPREERAEVKQGWRRDCYFCNKRFEKPSHLTPHLLMHTKEKLGLICHVCRKTFSSKQSLTRHRFTHLSEDEKSALVEQGSGRVCFFCQKIFPDNDTLHRHLVTHTTEKPFRCDKCDKSFTENCNLKLHQRSHTSNAVQM